MTEILLLLNPVLKIAKRYTLLKYHLPLFKERHGRKYLYLTTHQ